MRKSFILVIVLLIVVFLLGFVPEYLKARRFQNELRVTAQENTLLQLRDLAAQVYFQASQKNYGVAAVTSTRFFDRTQEVANQTPDTKLKAKLEELLSFRDSITKGLANGDPAVLNDLQMLYQKTRDATAAAAASS